MKRYYYLIFLLCLVFVCSCSDEQNDVFDSKKLDGAFSAAGNLPKTKSLAVWYNNKIIKEQYWGVGGQDVLHDVRSVTKTVMGLLIGIAIDKGLIDSVDQPIGDFLLPIAPYLTAEKAAIPLRYILTMSWGFPWSELNGPSEYSTWANSADQIKYVLERDLVNQPGSHFNYDSGASHILSVILSRCASMETIDFAKQNLFEPLGITNVTWSVDKHGITLGSAGLSLTTRDLIKIGRLIMNKGEYEGRRIVSSSWIEQATTQQINTNNAVPFGTGYGFQIWKGVAHGKDVTFGMGWGGQFLVIVPTINLIVVGTSEWRTSSESQASEQWYNLITIIMDQIIPAFN